MLKNAFISEIMGNTIKINRSKVVQRKISYQVSLLCKILDNEHDYKIVDMGACGVKDQNVNARFERKINARFVLDVYKLVKKNTPLLTF